jgi:hypothetical protein
MYTKTLNDFAKGISRNEDLGKAMIKIAHMLIDIADPQIIYTSFSQRIISRVSQDG